MGIGQTEDRREEVPGAIEGRRKSQSARRRVETDEPQSTRGKRKTHVRIQLLKSFIGPPPDQTLDKHLAGDLLRDSNPAAVKRARLRDFSSSRPRLLPPSRRCDSRRSSIGQMFKRVKDLLLANGNYPFGNEAREDRSNGEVLEG